MAGKEARYPARTCTFPRMNATQNTPDCTELSTFHLSRHLWKQTRTLGPLKQAVRRCKKPKMVFKKSMSLGCCCNMAMSMSSNFVACAIPPDFGLWSNRVTGAVDYFRKESKDLLSTVPIPAGSNFSNFLTTNVGNLVTKGVEFSINANVLKQKKVNWNVGFNVTYNDIKITNLSKVQDPTAKGVQTGGIAGGTGNTIQIHSVGYRPYSFYVYQQVYGKDGRPIEGVYEDRNRDGQINEDDLYRYQGPNPQIFAGLSSDITVGKFSAGFVMRANFGNYVYNNVASNRGVGRAILDPANFLSNGQRDVLFTNFSNNQYFSDHYVKNASFLRMDNLNFGYDFGNLISKKTTFRVTGNIQNVFVITEYDGLDPEVFGGIDNNVYPRPRTFTVGLHLGF